MRGGGFHSTALHALHCVLEAIIRDVHLSKGRRQAAKCRWCYYLVLRVLLPAQTGGLVAGRNGRDVTGRFHGPRPAS